MCSATCRTCLRRSNNLIDIFGDDSVLYKEFCSLSKIQISPNDGLPNTICLKCNKKIKCCIEFLTLCLKSDAYLRSSLDENNVSEDENYDQINYESETKGQCDITVYKNDQNIYYDVNRKNTSKNLPKLQCSICGKIMSSSFRLKTHLATHSQEKAFSCQFCDKRFSIQQNLKVHLRTHMGQKPHQCSICGKTFAQSSGLTVHKRKHTGSLPYNCNMCSRSFRTIGHLQYHIRSHTGEKSYECSTCERSFITKGDLNVHVMTHSGDKPHICSVCGTQFSRAANLRRHSKHTHKKSESHPCTQCKLEFTSKLDLELHACNRSKVKS